MLRALDVDLDTALSALAAFSRPRPARGAKAARALRAVSRSTSSARSISRVQRLFSPQCRPLWAMGNSMGWPCSRARTSAPASWGLKPSSWAAHPPDDPKLSIRAPASPAMRPRSSNQASSALRIAVPPGIRPAKISPLARATPASPSSKFSMCTGPTVVTATACGFTIRDRGPISPAWFMPISNTARRVAAGIRARVRGTPKWLL